MYHLHNHNPAYLMDMAGTCACHENNMGMVSPANVATLGAMQLGRSTYSYERAIVRVKAKINALKQKRSRVSWSIRKKVLDARIERLEKKLEKLKGYLKIKQKKIADKKMDEFSLEADDLMIFPDEEALFAEALAPEADITEYEIQDQVMKIDSNPFANIPTWAYALGGAGIIALTFALTSRGGSSRRRRNTMRVGKKRNNPKRKTTKRRKARRNRK